MNTTLGVHFLLDLFDCAPDHLDDLPFLEEVLRHAAREAQATLLQLVSHQFAPHGVSVVGLLAESHLSIHSWPEQLYVAVDVFTCGDVTVPRRACDYLEQALGSRRPVLRILSRGQLATGNQGLSFASSQAIL